MSEATDNRVSSILKTLTDSDTAALTVPESQQQSSVLQLLMHTSTYIYTVSHRSEYTPHIFVNILLNLFMWQHWRNYTLLQCKVVSVQLV